MSVLDKILFKLTTYNTISYFNKDPVFNKGYINDISHV